MSSTTTHSCIDLTQEPSSSPIAMVPERKRQAPPSKDVVAAKKRACRQTKISELERRIAIGKEQLAKNETELKKLRSDEVDAMGSEANTKTRQLVRDFLENFIETWDQTDDDSSKYDQEIDGFSWYIEECHIAIDAPEILKELRRSGLISYELYQVMNENECLRLCDITEKRVFRPPADVEEAMRSLGVTIRITSKAQYYNDVDGKNCKDGYIKATYGYIAPKQ